jgi:hypothetical protein
MIFDILGAAVAFFLIFYWILGGNRFSLYNFYLNFFFEKFTVKN